MNHIQEIQFEQFYKQYESVDIFDRFMIDNRKYGKPYRKYGMKRLQELTGINFFENSFPFRQFRYCLTKNHEELFVFKEYHMKTIFVREMFYKKIHDTTINSILLRIQNDINYSINEFRRNLVIWKKTK